MGTQSKLERYLESLLEKIVTLFDLKWKDRYHLRKRIVIRTDGAGGTPRIIGILDPFEFSHFLKGYSYKVAHKVCDAVSDWQEIPDSLIPRQQNAILPYHLPGRAQ